MAEPLVIPIGTTIKDLERGMRQARKEAADTASDIEQRFKRIDLAAQFGSGVLKGAIAAFSIDRIVRGFAEANAELARMGETAKRVGLDVERFQELRFAGIQNGLSGKDFGSGLEGLGEKLNEMRQSENGLSKLLDDNNIKYKDRKGEVIGVNDALGEVANLVRNAATEFDKIKIAEAAGLTRDWIPLLEQGAEAINRQASAARNAGSVIDADVIQKAKDFERDWAAAVDRWSTMFKGNLGGIVSFIDAIVAKASGLLGMVSDYAAKTSAIADLQQNGIEKASRDSIQWGVQRGAELGLSESDVAAARRRLAELNEIEREANRAREPLAVTVRPTGKKTDTSSLFSKGGGGGSGGGKSEEEEAQARLDKYVETLMRQNSVLDAEIATFGKSNAEKRAAVELAKAQVDLAKLDEPARQKVIADLEREIGLSEQKRTKLKSLKDAQDGLRDAQKFVGEAAVDAIEDLIINGGKAEDVIKRLTASLAKAALQAALLGQGPFASFFGTSGTSGSNGGMGGLFGLLFGGAAKNKDGGHISGAGTGRSDSILSWLSNGEFVTNARSTRKYGPLLEAINQDRLPAFADGGLVNSLNTIRPAAGSGSGMQVVVNNMASDQVRARPQRGNDGSLQIAIEAVKADIADDILHGRGSVGAAFGARQSGDYLRG